VTAALDATPLTVPTGGVARYTLELATALARNFPEDQYWLLSDQCYAMPKVCPENLHGGSGPRTGAERKWWLWGLAREMSRRNIDVFHGTDFSVPYLPQRPAVMTLHDVSPWLDPAWHAEATRVRRRTPLLLRWGLATMVITPSQAVRRQAIERFALSPDRVVAVPLAANDFFRPIDAPHPVPRYFLFVGTLEPRKNLPRLIEAWREVRKTHSVDLVLAGRARADSQAVPSGHDLSGELGLRILGAVPDAELPGLYSGALAVVYPSLYEGFGLPVLEAMQCGAVVITSRDPAILEVTGGETGLGHGGDGPAAIHVDATDTRALAEAMRAVADAKPSSTACFASIKERAIVRARRFSWDSTARQTREVYEAARRFFK
jgi:glycosyltransferase involved in cell wall biosynthesis